MDLLIKLINLSFNFLLMREVILLIIVQFQITIFWGHQSWILIKIFLQHLKLFLLLVLFLIYILGGQLMIKWLLKRIKKWWRWQLCYISCWNIKLLHRVWLYYSIWRLFKIRRSSYFSRCSRRVYTWKRLWRINFRKLQIFWISCVYLS